MASQKAPKHQRLSRACSRPAVLLLDLPDEVLMRIICCVHAADEHWMHHLSCTARIATVCSRLRACADEVYGPAGPRAAARLHLARLGAAASQLPRVEEFSVAGLRRCIEEGQDVVSRYETLARAVGMADAAWHRQHVRVSTMAFLDASAWLDRFVAHSRSLAGCVAATTAQLSGGVPSSAGASHVSPPATALAGLLQHTVGSTCSPAPAAAGPGQGPNASAMAAAAPLRAEPASAMAAPIAAAAASAEHTVPQGRAAPDEVQPHASALSHTELGDPLGAQTVAPSGCTAAGAATGSVRAEAAGSSGSDQAGHGSKAGGSGTSGMGGLLGMRLPDVAELMTSVCHQLLPGSKRLLGHAAPLLMAPDQQG